MEQIRPTPNKYHWPRWAAPTVECRKRDLVIRITDWTDDKDEPAFDVETYIGGVYDWYESESFTLHKYKTIGLAKAQAIVFAKAQIAKLL